MDDDDLYSRLHCSPEDSHKTLKASYQQLLLKLHPDKTEGRESHAFIELQEAWQVLGGEVSRAEYDARRTNSRLTAAQEAPLWDTVCRSQLKELGEGLVGVVCRCGGEYSAEKEEVEGAGQQTLLLDCDTCSLQIAVTS